MADEEVAGGADGPVNPVAGAEAVGGAGFGLDDGGVAEVGEEVEDEADASGVPGVFDDLPGEGFIEGVEGAAEDDEVGLVVREEAAVGDEIADEEFGAGGIAAAGLIEHFGDGIDAGVMGVRGVA